MKDWINLMVQARDSGIQIEEVRDFIRRNKMNHPVIEQIERTGYPLGYEEKTHYCDGCGDYIEDEVFEFDGDIYCGIRCLTQNTDIRYGNVYEFK